MARSVGMLFLKWLLIPAALTAVGYYVIGPKIGARLKSPLPGVTQPASAPADVGPAESTTASRATFPAPDVDVRVDSAQPPKKRKKRRRRRSTRPPTTNVAPAVEAAPPPDLGGSGGAATTGGGAGETGGGATGGN